MIEIDIKIATCKLQIIWTFENTPTSEIRNQYLYFLCDRD